MAVLLLAVAAPRVVGVDAAAVAAADDASFALASAINCCVMVPSSSTAGNSLLAVS